MSYQALVPQSRTRWFWHPEQETSIRKYVKKEPVASVKLPSVGLKVGSTAPGKVELHKVPKVKYDYSVIDNRTWSWIPKYIPS